VSVARSGMWGKRGIEDQVCRVQIKLMGTRENAVDKDFSGIPLEEEVEEELKETAIISMGTEISEIDLVNIMSLCDQVRTLLAVPVLVEWFSPSEYMHVPWCRSSAAPATFC
jgi:hypothetical protein